MMGRILGALILAVGVQTTCLAGDYPQKIETTDGFSVNLPSDWEQIPKEILNSIMKTTAQSAPNTERQAFDYGFQGPGSENWLDYPYIFIQARSTGKISESEFEAVKQITEAMDKGMKKAGDSFSNAAFDGQVMDTAYDSDAHILWSKMSMEVSGGRKVRALLGLLLTEKGVIQVAAYAKDEEFATYLPVFEGIIRNIEVAENLRYKPMPAASERVASGINWTKVIRAGLIGAVLAVVATLIGRLFKKKATGEMSEKND